MKTKREISGLKIFLFYTLFVLLVIIIAVIFSVANLSPTAAGYWGGNAKSVHDATEIGCELLGDLASLLQIPKWRVPLAFLCVASFMTCVALEFVTIPRIIGRRTAV